MKLQIIQIFKMEDYTRRIIDLLLHFQLHFLFHFYSFRFAFETICRLFHDGAATHYACHHLSRTLQIRDLLRKGSNFKVLLLKKLRWLVDNWWWHNKRLSKLLHIVGRLPSQQSRECSSVLKNSCRVVKMSNFE